VFEAPAGQPPHRCSASLLSPTVALTAGHRTDGTAVARVWFDENTQNNSEYPFGGPTSLRASRTPTPGFASVRERAAGLRLSRRRIIVLTEPVPTSVVSEYASSRRPAWSTS
jgi:V8-like Glu-specific endopeptidase